MQSSEIYNLGPKVELGGVGAGGVANGKQRFEVKVYRRRRAHGQKDTHATHPPFGNVKQHGVHTHTQCFTTTECGQLFEIFK